MEYWAYPYGVKLWFSKYILEINHKIILMKDQMVLVYWWVNYGKVFFFGTLSVSWHLCFFFLGLHLAILQSSTSLSSLLVSLLVCLFVWAYSNADSAAAASLEKSNLRFSSSSSSHSSPSFSLSSLFSFRLEIISAPARRSPPFSSAAAPFPFPNFLYFFFFLNFLINSWVWVYVCIGFFDFYVTFLYSIFISLPSSFPLLFLFCFW